MFNEIQVLRCLDHPNIVKLYEIYEDQQCVHLVCELVSGGELFDFIKAKRKMSESDTAKLMK